MKSMNSFATDVGGVPPPRADTAARPPTREVRAPRLQWQTQIALLCAFVSAVLLAAPTPTRAQATKLTDGLKAAVVRMDETRVYAMLAADTGALDDLLTADCLYGHSNGRTQTKAEFLAALKSGALRYTAIRYVAPPLVRLHGNETALLSGTAQLEVAAADGAKRQLTLNFLAVYVLRADRWQLVSYQSTPAAPPTPAPAAK